MGCVMSNLPKPDEVLSKYADEREAISNGSILDRYREDEQTKFDKARESDDFWNVLSSGEDRVKADSDNNGKISYHEYKEYILSDSSEPSVRAANKTENTYETNHYYHLDYSFYVVFGMVCITAIIITFLKRK